MKRVLPLCVCLLSITVWLRAGESSAPYESLGRLVLTQFVSAPFPHPARSQGHAYKDKFFSAAEHYQDSSVALFIPKGFRARSRIDFVVHFHGWGNNITNALGRYRLIEQFADGGRNAVLIVPQGPLNASDSFGGKLEDAGGFQRFMEEAMKTLRDRGLFEAGEIGRITLSGHSGGYEVISSIVARGGLSDHVEEIWLFDALYGGTEKFVLWFDHHRGRFIDIYTEHGGTKEETESLMTALKENRVPFYWGNESSVSRADLRTNRLIFLFSALPHDEVLQTHQTFRQLLETSPLPPIRR